MGFTPEWHYGTNVVEIELARETVDYILELKRAVEGLAEEFPDRNAPSISFSDYDTWVSLAPAQGAVVSVDIDGFWFCFTPRHEESEYETESLPWESLEKERFMLMNVESPGADGQSVFEVVEWTREDDAFNEDDVEEYQIVHANSLEEAKQMILEQ